MFFSVSGNFLVRLVLVDNYMSTGRHERSPAINDGAQITRISQETVFVSTVDVFSY